MADDKANLTATEREQQLHAALASRVATMQHHALIVKNLLHLNEHCTEELIEYIDETLKSIAALGHVLDEFGTGVPFSALIHNFRNNLSTVLVYPTLLIRKLALVSVVQDDLQASLTLVGNLAREMRDLTDHLHR